MLPGNSKLFFVKTGEGLEIDMSGVFDQLIQDNKEKIKDLQNEIDKWIQMDLENIIKSNSFIQLSLEWKLQILIHIWYDYRFLVNRDSLDNQIANLKKAIEVQIRADIQTEAFKLSETSKNQSLIYIEECALKTNELLVQTFYNNPHALQWDKDLLEERLIFLTKLKEIIELRFGLISASHQKLENGEKEIKKEKDEMSFLTIDPGVAKKMMILNELEVLDYLESYIRKNGKYLDSKLYVLISLVTGIEKIGSIKALMPFMRQKNHESKNNPYNSGNTREEVERIIFNFNNPG